MLKNSNNCTTPSSIRDTVKSEDAPEYSAKKTWDQHEAEAGINDCYLISSVDFESWEKAEDELIRQAKCALYRRVKTHGGEITSQQNSKDYLELTLAQEEREVFCALFLDTRHRVINFQKLFYGTIDGATVHPREVVKAALKLNAAAVIFAHNHPSGNAEPSEADITITSILKTALALIDIRVLDHIIIGSKGNIVSLAQRGKI